MDEQPTYTKIEELAVPGLGPADIQRLKEAGKLNINLQAFILLRQSLTQLKRISLS